MKRMFVLALAAAAMFPTAAFAQTTAAVPVPAITCPADEPIVWVNTRKNKYHLPGSPGYGKTKQGKYECESAAKAEGAVPAGKAH
jgi:hypothetical protein